MLEHALAWARRGFRIFPLGVGGKRPAGDGWRQYATTNEEVISKWWGEKPYNIGVLCNDMIVVDVDVKNGKPGLLSYLELGLPTDTLAVRTPSGGVHYYLSGPSTRNRAGIEPGVDVRSHHGYVVAPGSILADGGVYSLLSDLPVLPAPETFVARCGAPRERKESLLDVDLDTDEAKARALLWLTDSAPLAVEGDSGDHTTFTVACKLRDFGLSEDGAYEMLLDHWNEDCSPPWEPDELRTKVENAYTYATNPAGVLTVEAEFGDVTIEEPLRLPAPRAKWIDAGCALDFNQQWLFYQRLPRVGTAMLVGPSNSGKTYMSLEIARCLATGDPLFGTRPDDEGSSIILAAEGLSGLPARMHALGPLEVAAMPVSGLTDGETVKQLIADIAEKASTFVKPLRLIVIDTLTASGLLLDENNNSECGRAIKNLETMARHFNCLVLVTHHPPKSGSGARGGSALHAGCDTVLEVFYDGKPVRFLECTKGRDAPTGKWGSFTLPSKTLGADTRGRPITTCTVSIGNEERLVATKEPPHQDKLMAAFDHARVALNLGHGDPVPRSALRTAFGELTSFRGGHSSASRAFEKCFVWSEANRVLLTSVQGDETMVIEGAPPIRLPDGEDGGESAS